MTLQMPDASRKANSSNEAVVWARTPTHLEMLLEASQNNEKRLMALATFACDILTKIRGTSIPQDGCHRPERIGGTLWNLEESICNSGDSIHILEIALSELNGTI